LVDEVADRRDHQLGLLDEDVMPLLYADKSPQDAATALLAKAEQQAGGGSWELIAVGRVRYLSGDKPGGQALFDRAISRKAEASDRSRRSTVSARQTDCDSS
jgi:hypothetical protein